MNKSLLPREGSVVPFSITVVTSVGSCLEVSLIISMVVSLTGSLFVVCRPVVDICGVDFATIGDTVTMIGKVVVDVVVNVELLVVVEVVIVVVVVVVIKVVVEMVIVVVVEVVVVEVVVEVVTVVVVVVVIVEVEVVVVVLVLVDVVVEVVLIVGGVEMVLDGIVNRFGSVIFSVNSVGFIS